MSENYQSNCVVGKPASRISNVYKEDEVLTTFSCRRVDCVREGTTKAGLIARFCEVSALWRRFESPKDFEALFTQDFFLFPALDVVGVRGAAALDGL